MKYEVKILQTGHKTLTYMVEATSQEAAENIVMALDGTYYSADSPKPEWVVNDVEIAAEEVEE